VVVNLFHLGKEIERVLGTGDKFGAEITYSREDRLMETGGGIASALGLLGQDDFVVVNGDIYTDFDFSGLNSLPAGVMGHLILVDNPAHHPAGDFAIREGGVLARTGACLTYTGISVLSHDLFSGCESGPFPLRDLLLPGAAAGRLSGEHYKGFWSDVGTIQRYEELAAKRG
jgi:MurNAc alpha-1-phosphate uridylyltransferase